MTTRCASGALLSVFVVHDRDNTRVLNDPEDSLSDQHYGIPPGTVRMPAIDPTTDYRN